MTISNFYTRFDSHKNSLHAFAYSLTGDVEDAKDLYQDTALRVVKSRKSYKKDKNLRAWLFTIMKNVFINNYRRKAKMKIVGDPTSDLYLLNSGKAQVRNEAESNIIIGELKSMIESLPEKLKIPIDMKYQGYKYEEIANYMNKPLGTIKSRIFLAREQLNKMIKSRYPSAIIA